MLVFRSFLYVAVYSVAFYIVFLCKVKRLFVFNIVFYSIGDFVFFVFIILVAKARQYIKNLFLCVI